MSIKTVWMDKPNGNGETLMKQGTEHNEQKLEEKTNYQFMSYLICKDLSKASPV